MSPRYPAAVHPSRPTLSAAKSAASGSTGAAKKSGKAATSTKGTAKSTKGAATTRKAASKPSKAVAAASKPATKRTAATKSTKAASAKAAPKKTAASKASSTKAASAPPAKATSGLSAGSASPAARAGASATKRPAVQEPSGSATGGRKKPLPKGLKYKVGQQLVYPLQGVGKVERIEERTFRDQTLLYYIVYLEVSDMTVMVPVDKTEELGIRAIVPKTEANKALKLITEDEEPIPTDWKLRYQMNLDLLKKGAVSDIATVVRALYHRSQIKELPILERKLYDNALKLLVDEVSFSLGKEKDKVEAMILERLDEGVAQAAAK